MSAVMEEEARRWTTRRKSALVMGIIQGKTTVSEASRQFDLASSELEDWMDQAKAGMVNALRAKPEDVPSVRAVWCSPVAATPGWYAATA